MAEPAISVVIPAYNAAWCLGRAIDSVLTQTLRDYELIVVDDGSTDGTARLLEGYRGRLRSLTQPNGGQSSARNAGIQVARGRYVAFLDSDDWWSPGKLERQLTFMEAHPDVVFCSTSASVVDPDGRVLGEWRCQLRDGRALEAIFSATATIAGSASAVIARRAALVSIGGFDESLKGLEDTDLWMRLAAKGGYHCIDEALVTVAKRPGSVSRELDVMREAAIAVMRKNRCLLPLDKQGAFWRHAYVGMLSDYAKWAYRSGRRSQAMFDLLTGMRLAPISQGRLLLGLLAGMLRNEAM